MRTLAVAARKLSPSQYEDLNHQLQEARQALTDRETAVGKVFNAIESDLVLLGATGVEDQLQEGVAETLESLKAAGICVRLYSYKLISVLIDFINDKSMFEMHRLGF